MRFLIPTCKCIAIFAGGIIGGLIIAFWWTFLRAQTPSTLTANLPLDWKAASPIFDARIKKRFPVGTPVWHLVNGLSEQGFEPNWPGPGGEHNAQRIDSNYVCDISARVYWTIDKDSKVLTIRGIRDVGCL